MKKVPNNRLTSETRSKVNELISRNKDLKGTSVIKDLEDAKKLKREDSAKIAISEFNKWKRS